MRISDWSSYVCSSDLIGLLGLAPDVYGFCFAAIVVGYMIGAFLSGRFSLGVALERLVQFGTAVQLVGGLACVALYAAGVVPVAGIVGPVGVFIIGTGLGLPHAPASALRPSPHRAGAP